MKLKFAITLLVFLATSQAVASPSAQPLDIPVEEELRSECEYGIVLAFSGELERAEEVFTSLLSRSPGDSRALNNLGNLYVLRGELQVARAFYARAFEMANDDAGILLNRATTLMLDGDQIAAEAEAAQAIDLAGGAAEAASLLGLKIDEELADKGAERTRMARMEMLNLLHEALEEVPEDSTATADSTTASPDPSRRRRGTWRNAGSRGADQKDSTPLLYWKR